MHAQHQAAEAAPKYELQIGEPTDDGHNHLQIKISGWQCRFDAKCEEYFQLSGIAKPERVQAIVDAANSKAHVITDSSKKMIVSVLRSKVSDGLTSWVESQFALGASVEDVEKALGWAIHQIKRANAYAEAARADERMEAAE
jgi:hypothetical protein